MTDSATGNDAAIATEYGLAFSDEFGGTYVLGESLVVFFTANVADHEQRLRGLVRSPNRLAVHGCSRSWRELSASMLRAKERLMAYPDVGVREIGFGLRRGVLATRDQAGCCHAGHGVRRVVELAHPEEVYVDPVGTDR